MYQPFKKVLVANRGEIAVRILKACQAQGLETVAVYSDADRQALHVELADQAVYLGPAPSRESYLNFEAVLQAARVSAADAIHPGYGFLAENAAFAQACLDAGLVWIGPAPEVIEQMGSKTAARELAQSLGIPVIPGAQGDPQNLQAAAAEMGFPLLLKAVAGGGGRGMRLVESEAELPQALASAQREALQAFGDDRVYLEKYLPAVRHIEFQILGDSQGRVIHCFERECSLQRRYQKIIEESPSPVLSPELRQQMGAAAVKLAAELKYCGAATVEFVVDKATLAFYFLEVNTRLQVEHPVTELVTGLDLVDWQLKLAAGRALTLQQTELQQTGHAIECRLCAEEPAQNFQPAAGLVLDYAEAADTRIDSGIRTGSRIPVDYDSMLAKLIVWGRDRQEATRKLQRALAQTRILGLPSNLDFLQRLVSQTVFESADFDTRWIEGHLAQLLPAELTLSESHELGIVATLWDWSLRSQNRPHWQAVPMGWSNSPQLQSAQVLLAGQSEPLKLSYQKLSYQSGAEQHFEFEVAESSYNVRLEAASAQSLCLEINGLRRVYQLAASSEASDSADTEIWVHCSAWSSDKTRVLKLLARFPQPQRSEQAGSYQAAMPAKVLQILVSEGQRVEAGQALMVLESMKMESTLCANEAGLVSQLLAEAGEQVQSGATLLVIEALAEV